MNTKCPLVNYLQDVNDMLGRSYVFTIDSETDVDAVNTGNLMRFANHAEDEMANCIVNIIFAKGDYNATLVASRDI